MVVYTVKQIQGGQWAICRMGFALFKDMQLGPAIELARTVARDEYILSIGMRVLCRMNKRLSMYDSRTSKLPIAASG
jgi:hypothetical protein